MGILPLCLSVLLIHLLSTLRPALEDNMYAAEFGLEGPGRNRWDSEARLLRDMVCFCDRWFDRDIGTRARDQEGLRWYAVVKVSRRRRELRLLLLTAMA